MNLIRCANGHYYDAERFAECPHCNQSAISTVLQDENGESQYTMPMYDEMPPSPQPQPVVATQTENSGLSELVKQVKDEDDGGQATIGYFGAVETEPVVGWLVAISGSHYGEDFKLKTGRNFIGRASNMDVCLSGDASISREKHAIVLYEPRGNVFLVQPGDAKELFYLNDNVVLAAAEINAYDVLSLGETNLLFIPCCSDKFNWDRVKKKEDK